MYSRPVLESLSHLRCAPDASRRSLTLILGIWFHVYPHVHLFPCFSKYTCYARSERPQLHGNTLGIRCHLHGQPMRLSRSALAMG